MLGKDSALVVGPLFAARARKAGLVHTPVDGYQSSLLLGLLSWTRTLGLDVVATGKSSKYGFAFDPTGETLTITDHHHHEVAGLEPMPVEPAKSTGDNPMLYYLAVNRHLTRPLPAGATVTCDLVEMERSSLLWSLRQEMDSLRS